MDYVFQKAVNADKLSEELKVISAVKAITTDATSVTVHATGEIYGDQMDHLVSIINLHNISMTNLQMTRERRSAAVTFSNQLIADFTDENILLGITYLSLTNHVRKVLFQVTDALQTGSLYDAIDEISFLDPSILDARILTPARILSVRARIETFLGVPKATVWNQPRTW